MTLQFKCVGSLAGVTYLRYTILISPNKEETVVHCCDSALSVLVKFGVSKRRSRNISIQPVKFIKSKQNVTHTKMRGV